MKILKSIKAFFKKVSGLFRSITILLFRNIIRSAIFHGYSREWFARQYKVKRELYWHRQWNQLGKQQFILPFVPGKLIVCSKLELEIYKKKGLIGKNVSIRKLTNKSI